MSRLEAALRLAALAHAGQTDKAGQPFIGHPLRVMARGLTESEMIVGVLHDVIEDTNVCFQDLYFRQLPDGSDFLLTNEEAFAVGALTRNQGETYRQYIERLAKNPLAVAVKRNDILDNADPRRGWEGVPLSRYRWAWQYLFPEEPLPTDLAKNPEPHKHSGHEPHGNCCVEHSLRRPTPIDHPHPSTARSHRLLRHRPQRACGDLRSL